MLPVWFRVVLLAGAIWLGVLLVRGTTALLTHAFLGDRAASIGCTAQRSGCVAWFESASRPAQRPER